MKNDNNKKKIIFCTNFYPPNFVGGAELIVHSHAKIMKQLGNDVIVFTGDPQAPLNVLKKDIYEGLTVYRTYISYQLDSINFTNKNIEENFKKLLDDFSPDVVHFHNIIGLSIGIIHIAKSRGIKTILTLHDYWGFCWKNTIIKREGEICRDYSKCSECMLFIKDKNRKGIPIWMRKDFISMQLYDIDIFISPSQYLAQRYIDAGFPKEKFRVIWNGVDIQKFECISRSKSRNIRFTYIGYFGKHKGILVLLNAIQLIKRNDFRVNLIGDGDLINIYKKQVKEMRIDRFVKFWGKIDDIEDAYRETDVLILPSIWPENQPVTITEAMAAKIPVIASNIGGIPEIVEDEKTGYLFEAGNAEQLAYKMSEFILYPDRSQIFGENAHKKIINDRVDSQVEKILHVYDEKILSRENRLEEKLIVCIGKNVYPQCSQAMDFFLKKNQLRKYKFVMIDWLQDSQYHDAKLFWVVDNETTTKEVNHFINKIPLLVPEDNNELKKLCIYKNCGLYYNDVSEAGMCLEYFMDNENERIIMGKNIHKR